MNKTRVMIVCLFVLAFVSGFAVSSVLTHSHHPAHDGPMPATSWLSSELGLTKAQEEEMLKIWGNLGRPAGPEQQDRRHALSDQRDESIRKLIPAEKQKEYELILENHSKQMAELSEQRHKQFEIAVEKTKAILTEQQRTKYDAILAKRLEGRRGPGGSGPGMMGHGWSRQSSQSQPATTQPTVSGTPATQSATTSNSENSDSR